EEGKKLFVEKCVACHGANGEGNAESVFPRLQGQHYTYTLRQLQWMRDGLRKNANPVMLAHIKELDDATLGYIADYISRIETSEASKPDSPKEALKEKESDCD
ncbi:MAG: c-type cytochrome, partial [Thiotrichaceae bacterium]